MNLNVTVSIIVAICATTSPIFTAIINNRYQLKLKLMERQDALYEKTVFYQQKILENYLKSAAKCISFSSESQLVDYGEAFGLASLYAEDEFLEKMNELDALIRGYHWSEASAFLRSMIPEAKRMFRKIRLSQSEP